MQRLLAGSVVRDVRVQRFRREPAVHVDAELDLDRARHLLSGRAYAEVARRHIPALDAAAGRRSGEAVLIRSLLVLAEEAAEMDLGQGADVTELVRGGQ